MELFQRTIVFPLILFIICCFRFCIALDCGGAKVSSTIIVDKSGKANFTTIQNAINSVSTNNNQWVKILISAGIYQEKVEIPYDKPCIILKGSGKDLTTITYNGHQQTDTSATFSSISSNVVAKGITFKNSFNVAAVLNLQQRTRGTNVLPAVAASIHGDKSAFYDCKFVGFQDTLWVEGRHYFKSCIIEGAIDFIFGRGQSYFEDCTLNATSSGFITAQGRSSEDDPSGFVFRRGNVIGDGNNKTLLGRAYGPYSRVIFYGSHFGSVVAPAGWDAWNYAKQEDGFTHAEIECGGPGADTSKRVPWTKKTLSASELNKFSISEFIDQDAWLANIPPS